MYCLNKRKLTYRKDNRAMRPIYIYGCPKNFRESLATPTATLSGIFDGLLFPDNPIDLVNMHTKFEVSRFIRS